MLRRQAEELKESYQEKLENTFEMYKEAIKEHAYQSALNKLEDDYVPLDEFITEQEKVEVCSNLTKLSGMIDYYFKFQFKLDCFICTGPQTSSVRVGGFNV